MGNFDALDKAKKAAERASQTALGVRDQAALKVGGIKDLLVGKIADIKDAALSSVKEMVDDLNAHLPALREAGYALTEVSVELGIPPKVVATFVAQAAATAVGGCFGPKPTSTIAASTAMHGTDAPRPLQ
jgi:hypothetical protein